MAAIAVPVETATKPAYANEQKQHAKPHAETQQHAQETLLRELLENDAKYHASRIENTVGCALNVQRAKKELTVTNFERFKAGVALLDLRFSGYEGSFAGARTPMTFLPC